MEVKMIPNKVKVAGINYEVKLSPVIEIAGDRNHAGKCSATKGLIEIAEFLSGDIREQIFVHELVHACLDQAGYDEHDEELVTRFSIVLHQVLKDNQLEFGGRVMT